MELIPIVGPTEIEIAGTEIPMEVATTGEEIPMGLDMEYRPTIIETYFPPGGLTGDLLSKRSSADYDVEWITPANSAEQDNTRPITAAAVYTEIGNINALLATI